MTNDLLLSTEGPMGYPIRPRGAITMHVAYTSASGQAETIGLLSLVIII